MTHDQECTFDPKYCRDCKLQAEARADEREKAAQRVKNGITCSCNCHRSSGSGWCSCCFQSRTTPLGGAYAVVCRERGHYFPTSEFCIGCGATRDGNGGYTPAAIVGNMGNGVNAAARGGEQA